MLAAALPFDPAKRAEACGTPPGNVCRLIFEQTDSVGLAKAAEWLRHTPLRIVLVLVGAFLLNRIVRRAIRRFAARIEGAASSGRLEQIRQRAPGLLDDSGQLNLRSAARAQTIATVLRSACTAIITAYTLIYVLDVIGLNLGPLVAGAGVAGVALGFGAQSLVKDFLTGIFMLIEDQYGVGDVVDVGAASGVVEGITLRTTRVRDVDGTLWHVPNGQILRVGNKSQEWSRAVVDVSVMRSADLRWAREVIEEAAKQVWATEEWSDDVLDAPEVLGVESFGPDAVSIRLIGKTRPGAQFAVSRALRAAVVEALEAAKIELGGTRAGTAPSP